MHFEFRHSSCTGRVHQHRTVLGHHGFKFCPFSQTIPRMASAPSIPKDIFWYMIILAFWQRKTLILLSPKHARVTRHRYLCITMNLSTKQPLWKPSSILIHWTSRNRLQRPSQDYQLFKTLRFLWWDPCSRSHTYCRDSLNHRTHWRESERDDVSKMGNKNPHFCRLVKRLISSKKGARSKRSRSAINKQLWESCKPYLSLRRLTWIHNRMSPIWFAAG